MRRPGRRAVASEGRGRREPRGDAAGGRGPDPRPGSGEPATPDPPGPREWPSDLLSRTPEEAARRVALRYLAEAESGASRVEGHRGGRDGDDPEDEDALHDFRVGLRRLRSTVRAFREELGGSIGRRRRRALKDIAGATGPGRDAEVQLELLEQVLGDLPEERRGGARGLAAELTARRDAGYRAAHESARALRAECDRLREKLSRGRIELRLDEAPSTYGRTAAAKARAQEAELRDALVAVRGPRDVEGAHAARITAKRLRYLLEPIAPFLDEAKLVVKPLKALQDLLGDLHDVHLLERALRARVEASGDVEEPGEGGLEAGDERATLVGLSRALRDRAEALHRRLRADYPVAGSEEGEAGAGLGLGASLHAAIGRVARSLEHAGAARGARD